ncbi:MAG: hypothetical protein Kow0059_13840 [Candidatus Sumerlaeia bacterium]
MIALFFPLPRRVVAAAALASALAVCLPAQQRWYSQTTPMTAGRQMYGAAVLGDFIYLIGGNNANEGYTLSVEMARISPSGQLGPWQQTTPLPQPRSYIANTTIALNDIVYVAAGYDGQALVNMNTILWSRPRSDGHLEPWRTSPPFPGEGLSCSVALATPGFIHILGGFTQSDEPTRQVWSARVAPDGQVLDWVPGPPLPVPLWFHCGGVAAGRVWLWGGLLTKDNTSVNTAVYTAPILSSGQLAPWQVATTSALPQGFYSASSAVTGSYLLSFCPRYSGGLESNDVWYALASPQGLSLWQKLSTDLPSKLYIAVANDYRRGFVYIPGGRISKTDHNLDNHVYYFQLAGARQAPRPPADTDEAVTVASAPPAATATPGTAYAGTESLSYTQLSAAQGVHPGFMTYEQARQTAAVQRRPIILYFFNDKARRCQEQKAILQNFNTAAYAGRVIFAEVDTAKFPQITQQYGVFRIPHWIVFDAAGQTLLSRSGVLSAQDLHTQALRVAK